MASRESSLHVALDDAEALRFLDSLALKLASRGDIPKIIARAQNDALKTAQAEAVRAIREEYNAPAGKIKNAMTLKKARQRHLQAVLTLKGRMSVELIHYGARPGKSGVTVKVLKSSRRSAIRPGGKQGILATKKRRVSATWIAKGHVFARVDDSENPIQRLWGPSFLTRLSNEDVRRRLETRVRDRFTNRLRYYADQVLQ
ncbi:MAG: phage tail protein [Desulfovibrionaceae bacterium]|nr:phage tail protein [Desulfovibrionaceae bacterium]